MMVRQQDAVDLLDGVRHLRSLLFQRSFVLAEDLYFDRVRRNGQIAYHVAQNTDKFDLQRRFACFDLFPKLVSDLFGTARPG